MLFNHEAFAKGEKAKKGDFRSLEEFACDLIYGKDENCKHLKAVHRSIARGVSWSTKHSMSGLLEYSPLFVTGLAEIPVKGELLCMQQGGTAGPRQ